MHRGCPFKRFVRPERIDTNSIKTTTDCAMVLQYINGITYNSWAMFTATCENSLHRPPARALRYENPWFCGCSVWILAFHSPKKKDKTGSLQFERFESISEILGFSVWWKRKVGKVGQVQGLQAPRPKQAQRSQSQTWPTKCQECCRTTKVSLSPVFVDFPDK